MLDDKPMIVRARQNLRSIAGHPELPTRLRIVWQYECDNDSGLPSSIDLKAMEGCENLLVDAFEHDNCAILTHVLTCDGLRQWVFYVSNLQEVGERINGSLPHDQPFPIELTAEDDAEWSEYLETLHSLSL
jgi:hypothetical protein